MYSNRKVFMEDTRNFFQRVNAGAIDLNLRCCEYWSDSEWESYLRSLEFEDERELNFDDQD
jgi:hypothetical protein